MTVTVRTDIAMKGPTKRGTATEVKIVIETEAVESAVWIARVDTAMPTETKQ